MDYIECLMKVRKRKLVPQKPTHDKILPENSTETANS